MQKCLQRDPKQRLTAKQALEELENFEKSLQIPSDTSGLFLKKSKFH